MVVISLEAGRDLKPSTVAAVRAAVKAMKQQTRVTKCGLTFPLGRAC
jgi:hypothetical protein